MIRQRELALLSFGVLFGLALALATLYFGILAGATCLMAAGFTAVTFSFRQSNIPVPESGPQREELEEEVRAGIRDLNRMIDDGRTKTERYSAVMDRRGPQNLANETTALDSAVAFIKLLEERRDALIELLSRIPHNNFKRSELQALLYGDLYTPCDSAAELTAGLCHTPIPRHQWKPLLNTLCKQVARKPSFLQILRDDVMKYIPANWNQPQ